MLGPSHLHPSSTHSTPLSTTTKITPAISNPTLFSSYVPACYPPHPPLPASLHASTSTPTVSIQENHATTALNQTTLPTLPSMQPPHDHLYHVGLLQGQFADTLLTVTSAQMEVHYRVHALILAQEQFFLDALVPSTAQEYLYKVHLEAPLLANQEAVEMVLAYVYARVFPNPSTPATAMGLLTLALTLHLTPLSQHMASLLPLLELKSVESYLPLLDTPAHPLIFQALLHHLHHHLHSPELLHVFSLLHWDLLKQLLEKTVAIDSHALFEFAKRVLGLRKAQGYRDESVVVAFGHTSGLLLVRKGEKRHQNATTKKVWKVQQA